MFKSDALEAKVGEILRPIIEDRLAKAEEYGSKWEGKPVSRALYSPPSNKLTPFLCRTT